MKLSEKQLLLYLVSIGISFFCLLVLVLDLYNVTISKIGAVIVILYSAILVFKCKDNFKLWIFSLVIMYFNYSVCVYSYFEKDIKIPMNTMGNSNRIFYYGMGIYLLALFMVAFVIIFDDKICQCNIKINQNKKNIFCEIILFLVIGYILIFMIDRTSYTTYTVAIEPAYEYLYIFFLYALYYSGNCKTWKIAWVVLASIAILQDLVYGGRVTSLQILILLVLYFEPFLNKMKVALLGIGAIITFTVVGIWRSKFSLNISFIEIIENLYKSKLALDTSVLAYFSSIQNIISANSATIKEKIVNFGGFIADILGVNIPGYYDVTTLSNVHYGNISAGGGYVFSYFYFWFGIIGVILAGIIFAKIINNLSKGNMLSQMLLLITVINTPRWFLYSPLTFFRAVLLGFVLGIIRLNHKTCGMKDS